VIDESLFERQLVQPVRWRLWTIKMHLAGLVREVVRVALQLKRRSATDGERILKKRLEQDDHTPPDERALGSAVDLARRLL